MRDDSKYIYFPEAIERQYEISYFEYFHESSGVINLGNISKCIYLPNKDFMRCIFQDDPKHKFYDLHKFYDDSHVRGVRKQPLNEGDDFYIYLPEAFDRMDDVERLEVKKDNEWIETNEYNKETIFSLSPDLFSDYRCLKNKIMKKTPLLTEEQIDSIYRVLYGCYYSEISENMGKNEVYKLSDLYDLYDFYKDEFNIIFSIDAKAISDQEVVLSLRINDLMGKVAFEDDKQTVLFQEINKRNYPLVTSPSNPGELEQYKSLLRNFKIESSRYSDGYSIISGAFPTELIDKIKNE